MKSSQKQPWYVRMFRNSRFWILLIFIVLSINVVGLIQYNIPAGTLQVTRMEQAFGFISVLLLYIAIFASPLTKVFPNLPFKKEYIHARRAIGVSAFYYAFLHVYITFFNQLGGFAGLGYFNATYSLSFLFGIIALGILFIMAATSFDWVIKKMGYKKWKLLHRLVYIATFVLLLHIMLIGPHFTNLSVLGIVTYIATAILVVFEVLRIRISIREARANKAKA
jgi:sulfoxide reductase heme-binding subunit YedZ